MDERMKKEIIEKYKELKNIKKTVEALRTKYSVPEIKNIIKFEGRNIPRGQTTL